MKKLAYAINIGAGIGLVGVIYLWNSTVLAQCNGIFPANTICGNLGPASAPPAAFSAGLSLFGPGIATSGNIATFGNTTGTQLYDPAHNNLPVQLTMSGAVSFYNDGETPLALQITQGSSTNFVTTNSPTVGISRQESLNILDATGGQNAALDISVVANNHSDATHNAEANGMKVQVGQGIGSDGDIAGGFYFVQNFGNPTGGKPHQTTAVFADALTYTLSSTIATIQVQSGNNTGTDHDANGSLSIGSIGYMTPLDVIATGANRSSYGMVIRKDNGFAGAGFDSAIQIQGDGIGSRTISGTIFDVRASGANILSIIGAPFGPYTYTRGFDLRNGTFSSTTYQSSGFAVTASGTVNASGFSDNNFTVDVTGNTSTALLTGTTITGTVAVSTPTMEAQAYKVGATNTAGVSCSAGTTSAATLTVVNGIVTHC